MRRAHRTSLLVLAAWLVILSAPASAQSVVAGDPRSPCSVSTTTGRTIPERLDILHSLNTSKEVAQPAFAQYTKPEDGRASGAVSAATKYELYATACRSVGPFAEYIWNNATSKRQNTLRAGVDAEWQVRAIGPKLATSSPLLLGQLNYRGDREKHTESVQSVVQLTWVEPNQSWPAPNATWRVGRLFDFVWAPLAGVVYDQVVQAKDRAARGAVVRLAPQVDAVLYPAGLALDRRLELAASYLFQVDIVDGTSEADDHHSRRRASVSFFPYRSDDVSAGLSVSHTSGEDPTKGYVSEKVWQLGFTLRVK
jgi:hypothetical protein